MKRIDSPENGRYKGWKKLKDKKYRMRSGELLVEGIVVVKEVAREGYVKELLIDEEKCDVIDEFEALNLPITVLNHRLFIDLQSTETSQGVIALCRHFLRDLSEFPRAGRLLYTDGVQDPGNLGGMIRSAEAFNFDGILLGPSTVDSANDKCIRASMASAFRVPIAGISDEDFLALHDLMPFYALDIRGEIVHKGAKYDESLVLIVGNEAHGIRDEILDHVDVRLRIPMKETIDSLNANVATSIAMYMIGGGE